MPNFFTSDWHLCHKNIIKYCDRPFKSTSEMNQAIIDGINNKVEENDTLYHLGDILFMGKNNYKKVFDEIISQINCKNLFFLPGNHDPDLILTDSRFLPPIYEVKQKPKKIVLCHYPIASWNGKYNDAWHLYGHEHANLEDKLNTFDGERKSLDVGVDNAYKILGKFEPFSTEDIQRVFDSDTNRV